MTLLNLLIIGHGSQAKAWASNLKNSNVNLRIGLRKNSKSIENVIKSDFKYLEIDAEQNYSNFDGIILLTPDHTHHSILELIAPHIASGGRIIYAHGYSMEKHSLACKYRHLSHLLLAPKAIASEIISLKDENKPIPAAFSLEYALNVSKDMQFIQNLANQLGMTGRLIQTTFKEETSCDLFTEQTILCSVLPRVLKLSYDILVKNGVSKDLAFVECCIESKFILNTILSVGFSKFFDIISPNALIGADKANSNLFSNDFINKFESLFDDIHNRKFFDEIENANIDTLRKKMVSLYTEGDIEETRMSLKEYLI